MSNIRELVKKNENLYDFSLKVRNRVPKKLYYPKNYFNIMRMLNCRDLNIDEFRKEKLCNLLKEALEYVPYYKNLDLGIKSQDINEENAMEVFNIFPILDKKIIKERSSDFINIKYKQEKLIKRTSGWSTGPGIDIWRTRGEELLEKCFYDYQWGKTGYKNNSKVVRMACEGLKNEDEYPISYAGDKMKISPNHLNNKWMEEIFNKIKQFNPAFFHAYPSSFQFLLQYMKDNNLHLDNIKGIFLASEIVTENILNLCEEVFKNTPVIFSYGLSERTNLAWGEYNQLKILYKCDDVYGFSENFINEDGFPEIVGTSYWNYAMPFIRYNTHDIGEIENGIISNLDGRTQELLITKQGEKIPGINICIDKFTWNYVYIIQVVQNEPGKIEFHIKPKDNFNLSIKEKIISSQKAKWGNMFDILVVIDNRISKTASGKLRLIINNIGRQDVNEG